MRARRHPALESWVDPHTLRVPGTLENTVLGNAGIAHAGGRKKSFKLISVPKGALFARTVDCEELPGERGTTSTLSG